MNDLYSYIKTIPDMPAYLTQLADKMQASGGAWTTGKWLQNASTLDLCCLKDSVLYAFWAINLLSKQPKVKDNREPDVQDTKAPVISSLLKVGPMLTDMLCLGEGMSPAEDRMTQAIRLSVLMHFVQFEILKRKGYKVTIDYRAVTLDESAMKNIKPAPHQIPQHASVTVDEADLAEVAKSFGYTSYVLMTAKRGINIPPPYSTWPVLRSAQYEKSELAEDFEEVLVANLPKKEGQQESGAVPPELEAAVRQLEKVVANVATERVTKWVQLYIAEREFEGWALKKLIFKEWLAKRLGMFTPGQIGAVIHIASGSPLAKKSK